MVLSTRPLQSQSFSLVRPPGFELATFRVGVLFELFRLVSYSATKACKIYILSLLTEYYLASFLIISQK